ncbi:MAG: C40 family peptidase, partial [Parasporobacterium sp.]|nr:C40 family peptidase [Parasporobacterium sp.]
DKGYTGFGSNSNGDWYCVNGKVKFSAEGLFKGTLRGEKAWYYVHDGKVTYTDTVAKNSYGWWFVRNGKVDKGYTGFGSNKNGDWYCQNGKVSFGTSDVIKGSVKGKTAWWYVKKGKVTYTDTIAYVNGSWWMIKNGRITEKVPQSMTGIYAAGDKWGYFSNGKLKECTAVIKGTVKGKTGWWYVENGYVNFSKNGYFYSGIRTYSIVNGKAEGCNYYYFEDSIILPDGGYNLSTANIGIKVLWVNRALLGYNSSYFTNSTASAVWNFQYSHGLYPTGIVDLVTWKAIGYSEYDWYHLGAYVTPIKVDMASDRNEMVNAMLATAQQYVGSPYYPGASAQPGYGVDCSGLIYQCLYSVGINPATNIIMHARYEYEYTSAYLASDQYLGIYVSVGNLQPGDLVFYGGYSVNHVGIYAGYGLIYDSWPGIGVTLRGLYSPGNILYCRRVV